MDDNDDRQLLPLQIMMGIGCSGFPFFFFSGDNSHNAWQNAAKFKGKKGAKSFIAS